MANALTVARVILIFVVIAVWERDRVVENVWLDLAMVPLATASSNSRSGPSSRSGAMPTATTSCRTGCP
jgi:hypothetical protein